MLILKGQVIEDVDWTRLLVKHRLTNILIIESISICADSPVWSL